jgi:hypothetical protein
MKPGSTENSFDPIRLSAWAPLRAYNIKIE